MNNVEVAFEWFERADYPNIRQVMEDKHRLPASFEDWEKSAEAGEQALSNSRHIVVRTLIESQAFVSWCREHEVKANAQSRLRYCKERQASAAIAGEEVGEASARIGEHADKASEAAATGTPALAKSARRGQILVGQSRGLAAKAMRFFRFLSRHRR